MRCALLSILIGAGPVGCAHQRPVLMLTDFGTQDHYAAVLTAGVLRTNPRARILTVSHEIEPFNIVAGAFVLAAAVPEFTTDAVVLAVVDPGVGTERAAIVVQTQAGHLLVGPDNGLFDPVIQRAGGARAVYQITNRDLMRPGALSSTFHGRDIFSPVAGHLSRGVAPHRVGPRLNTWVRLPVAAPRQTVDRLEGTVLQVDHYGNLLTNMPQAWLQRWPLGTPLQVMVGQRWTAAIHERTYGAVPPGQFVVLGNQSGWIEIAQNQAHGGRTLGVSVGQSIAVRSAPQPPGRAP